MGYSNIVTFIDDGVSGVTMNRPGFNDMMQQLEENRAAALLVKDYCEIMGLNQKDLENKAFWLSPFFF